MRMMVAMAAVALMGAHDPGRSTIKVERAMLDADAAPTKDSASGGYVRLTSVGRDDVLVGASCECAKDVDLHRIVRTPKPDMLGKQVLALPANRPTDIAPGSDWHIWVGDIQRPLKDGEKVTLTLKFEKAGAIPVDFAIRASTKSAWKTFEEKR